MQANLIPSYQPNTPRPEQNLICAANGEDVSYVLQTNVSGHTFVQVAGDTPRNAILACSVCGIISNGEFDDLYNP